MTSDSDARIIVEQTSTELHELGVSGRWGTSEPQRLQDAITVPGDRS